MKLALVFSLFLSLFAVAEEREARIILNAPKGTVVEIYANKNELIKRFTMVDTQKTFKSPPVDVNSPYSYDFILKYEGKESRYHIDFRGGETKTVTLADVQETRSEQNAQLGAAGRIRIFVPNRRAIVIIDGIKMEDQEGELREFKTPALSANETRTYKIRLDYTDDATNRKVERDRVVYVRSGEVVTLKVEDFIPELR